MGGPKPRSYNLAMNRKERRLALRTALMARIDDVTVVKGFGSTLDAPKTREITDALGRLGIASDAKVLIVLTDPSDVVRRSVRNLEKVKLIAANQLTGVKATKVKGVEGRRESQKKGTA